MHLTYLPEEILNRIVAALDSPIDLRNLANVCSQLRPLVDPYHTQFRVIRTPLITSLWKKLASNRLLAQNVRILELQPSTLDDYSEVTGLDAPVVPTIFSDLELPSVPEPDGDEEDPVGARRAYDAAKNVMDLEAEHMLLSALKGMSGLTSFKWNRTPPLINPAQEDDIWITLAKCCPSLNSIDVFDREKLYEPTLEERDDPAYQRPTRNPNFYLFQDLKLFSLKSVAFDVGVFAFPTLEQGGEMLVTKCPRLEILKLECIIFLNPLTKTVNATPILSTASWAFLRELTLFGFNFIAAELAAFLVSHPTIEVLSLESIRIDESLVVPPGVLPHLKRLAAGGDSAIIDSILDSPTSLPRPLEGILGAFLNGAFLDKLEDIGSGTTLKELCCKCHGDLNYLITRLSGIAPNLECLRIVAGLDTKIIMDRSMYPVFGQLPYLQTLTGVRFIGSTSCQPASENTEIMRALVAVCPNLRRINWFLGDHYDLDSIVVIERNGSHVSWYIVREWSGYEGSIDTGWGEAGRGSFEL